MRICTIIAKHIFLFMLYKLLSVFFWKEKQKKRSPLSLSCLSLNTASRQCAKNLAQKSGTSIIPSYHPIIVIPRPSSELLLLNLLLLNSIFASSEFHFCLFCFSLPLVLSERPVGLLLWEWGRRQTSRCCLSLSLSLSGGRFLEVYKGTIAELQSRNHALIAQLVERNFSKMNFFHRNFLLVIYNKVKVLSSNLSESINFFFSFPCSSYVPPITIHIHMANVNKVVCYM